jgi:prepilin-type N-terminal cleavage/methylation domain-containing protein
MGRRASLKLPGCRRGMTLLEVVVCLAVLGLFVTGFVRHLGGTAAASSRLAERDTAVGVARVVRALLAAEDPWAAPASRALTLDAAGNPAPPGPGAYTVRIAGSVLCAGGAMPLDNPELPPPGGCAGGRRAVRRWRVTVGYATAYAAAERDSVVTMVDVDAVLTPSTPLDWSTTR